MMTESVIERESSLAVGTPGRYGTKLFDLDTPLLLRFENGKKTAVAENYRLWGIFYLLVYSLATCMIVAAIITGIPLMLTSSWGVLEKNGFPPNMIWAYGTVLASIIVFPETWPTVFSQFKKDRRRLVQDKNNIILENGTGAHTFAISDAKFEYRCRSLFGKVPFKVITFYLEGNGQSLPFYQVVMKLSLTKDSDYRHKDCDDFVEDVSSFFGMPAKSR